MVPLDEANALVDRMREGFYSRLPVETVTIGDAIGRKLASDALAQENVPGCDLCTMDGYALCTSDRYPLWIAGEALAGNGFGRIQAGQAVYVTTGARLPAECNAS
jgi:molybdopterin biosynthesis enzyme